MNGKFAVTGWIVAAVLAVVLFAGGFQGAQDKYGVVDLNKAVQDSEMGKKNRETLNAAVSARQGIIEFMQKERVLTVDQAMKLKTLSLKTAITDSEKKDLDKVKADVIQSAKNYDELNQKQNPTEDDRKLLQQYSQWSQQTAQSAQDWGAEFRNDLEDLQTKLINDSVKGADAAIHEIAKKDGYTVVYSSPAAAVYGSNDLTEAVTKALNAQK